MIENNDEIFELSMRPLFIGLKESSIKKWLILQKKKYIKKAILL